MVSGPRIELAQIDRADFDVLARPGPSAGVVAGDRAAAGAVHSCVARVEAPLDVDDVAAGIGSDPVQVTVVVIPELFGDRRSEVTGCCRLVI